MRAVVQRVTEARVRVGDRIAGEIGRGLARAAWHRPRRWPGTTCDTSQARSATLRVFEGDDGKPMDRSVLDIGGAVLVVSQFTLYGDMRGDAGRPSTLPRRPNWLARCTRIS